MKIKAFTIFELLVSILISGIVISTAYSVFIFSNKQFFKFSSIKTDIRDYFELSSTLKRDVEMAKKVIKHNEDHIEMQLTDKTILYQFEPDYITRTFDFHTDTFLFQTTITELTTLTEEHLIDFFKLNVNDQTLSFYKDYGAMVKLEE